MDNMNTDRIHKEIALKAAPARVWQALTDSNEFGQWFGVRLEGSFQVGEEILGQITHPGYEHLKFKARVERMDPMEAFAFRWQPHAIDPEVDYSNDPSTLVLFRLKETEDGTLLAVTESGFDALPKDLRAEAFLRNEGGWAAQVLNIQKHLNE